MAARFETTSLLAPSATAQNNSPIQNSTILVHSVALSRPDDASNTTCCGHNYRIQCIRSKGAMAVLLWGLLLHMAIPFDTSVHLLRLSLNSQNSSAVQAWLPGEALYRMLFILYPFMGWLADAKIGRYKAIVGSIVSIFIASVLMIVGYLIHIFAGDSHAFVRAIVTILLGVGVLFNVGGFASFDANVIPFLTDQVLGASGESLSALVHWYFWVSALAEIVNISLHSISIDNQHVTLGTLVVHCICTSIVLIACIGLRKWLDTTPLITNPIKLIIKVLRYACKNKYARNRSALTYWEEVTPSRIDLGKEKYGGPFSEEEVEDVKTSLRLLPLVFLSGTYGLMLAPITFIKELQQPNIDNKVGSIAFDLVENNGIQNAFFLLIFIAVFHFLVYPILYNYIPSVLKWIGLGLFLSTLYLLYTTILDPIATAKTNNTELCLLQNITSEGSRLQLEYYWALPAVTINGLAQTFIVPFAFEFIIAQTPGPMKGLMVGLWFASYGIIQTISLYIYIPFKYIPLISVFSCTFYYYATKTLISFLTFALFLGLAYKYKLRTRNVPINFNILAENHYNKYLSINSVSGDGVSYDSSMIRDADRSDTSSSCSSCD
ncbi:PREDICTED: solute carrier family 15 member 4-like [Amphimedon queenslandica]|uniref:Major facilitator superfamily (MFS) profile domain-containing protein n=1 Tax=Amphimedon queenslandica TaxID=400682 RepID=A0A1X7VMH9_AMPQE|nr:PREDICTED: solute carrier family 15 member 4-like [Amphimedon queenslandica]|eukprot:XP_011409749.1 PREDICTED: solute carrier family 15 member 4-like [Amphimedon queenslandica]